MLKNKIVKFAQFTLRQTCDDEQVSLSWSIRAGYPRVSVIIGDLVNKNNSEIDYNKIITAPFDFINLYTFFNIFRNVINHQGETKRTVDCYNLKFENGERTNEMYIQATVGVGKDKRGVIYIYAIQEGKKKVRFNLLPNKWFKYYNEDSIEITDTGELSKILATSYLNSLIKAFDAESINHKEVVDIK